jgi:uncharacterized protein DUF4180
MLTAVTENGLTFLEATPGHRLFQDANVSVLLEACFAVPARLALLYTDNLPPAFFDVSSQQAGTVLQKLRRYGVRLAVVASADAVATSRRFGELAAAERRDRTFALFDSRAAAIAWLTEPPTGP